jgi:hypothetical protein
MSLALGVRDELPARPRLAGGTCGRRRYIRQGCGKSPSSDPPQSRWFPVWVSASRRRLKDAKASPDAPERATSWRERPSWLLRSDGATGTEAVVLAWLCSLWTGDSPDAAPGITQPANSDNRSGPVEFLQVRPTDPSASSRDDVSHGDWRGHDVVRLGRDRVRPGTPMSRRSGLRLAIVDAVPSRELSPLPSVLLAVRPLAAGLGGSRKSVRLLLRRGTDCPRGRSVELPYECRHPTTGSNQWIRLDRRRVSD